MEQSKTYYGGKARLLGLLAAAITVAALCVAMLSQQQHALPLAVRISAWLSLLGFTIGGAYVAYLLMQRRPSVKIGDATLVVLGFPPVRWEEISSVYIFESYNKKFLGIKLKDKESFISKLSPLRRFFANLAKTSDWPPISIAQAMLSEPVETILVEIRAKVPP